MYKLDFFCFILLSLKFLCKRLRWKEFFFFTNEFKKQFSKRFFVLYLKKILSWNSCKKLTTNRMLFLSRALLFFNCHRVNTFNCSYVINKAFYILKFSIKTLNVAVILNCILQIKQSDNKVITLAIY